MKKVDIRDILGGARQVSAEEYGRLFDAAWDELRSSFKKYEGLQSYVEGEDSSAAAFLAGDNEEFLERLRREKSADKPFYEALRPGVSLQRVHGIAKPLTPYLRAELLSYIVTSQLGENIRCVSLDSIQKMLGTLPPDLVLFDGRVGFLLDYDADGKLVRAHHVSNQKNVNLIERCFDEIFAAASDFRLWLDEQGTLRPRTEALLADA